MNVLSQRYAYKSHSDDDGFPSIYIFFNFKNDIVKICNEAQDKLDNV